MQSIESNASNFKVDPVFSRKPVKVLKKHVGIGLVRTILRSNGQTLRSHSASATTLRQERNAFYNERVIDLQDLWQHFLTKCP